MASLAFVVASVAAPATSVIGCGSSPSDPPPSAGDGYEAVPPDFPAIVDNGGPKLTAPKLVTITWAGDPSAATLQDFDAKLGASAYWKATTAEYGIGPATSTNLVVASAPPSTWDDTEVDAWVKTQAQSRSSGWPPPDGQTLYVVYLPASVTLTSMGKDACRQYSGYHTDLHTDPDIAYALIPEGCYRGSGYSLLDNATSSAAHEIVEAAADPFTNASPGVIGFDRAHLAWEIWTQWQDEIADACEYGHDAYYREGADLPYLVARIWSNASAQAGHDPCGPRTPAPYFDVAPLGLADVAVLVVGPDGRSVAPFRGEAWHLAVGQSLAVKVAFFSDVPSDPWQVRITEGGCCGPPEGVLAIEPSTLSGKNGDVAVVTLTAKGAPAPRSGNAVPLTFSSASTSAVHVRPALVVID